MMDYAPIPFPFSILDYGCTAAALVVLGVVVWLFVKFLNNHMSKVTEVLEDCVQVMRGMRDEFFRLSATVRDAEADVKEDLDELNRAVRRRQDGPRP